jgi:hypothetical protein
MPSVIPQDAVPIKESYEVTKKISLPVYTEAQKYGKTTECCRGGYYKSLVASIQLS